MFSLQKKSQYKIVLLLKKTFVLFVFMKMLKASDRAHSHPIGCSAAIIAKPYKCLMPWTILLNNNFKIKQSDYSTCTNVGRLIKRRKK